MARKIKNCVEKEFALFFPKDTLFSAEKHLISPLCSQNAFCLLKIEGGFGKNIIEKAHIAQENKKGSLGLSSIFAVQL